MDEHDDEDLDLDDLDEEEDDDEADIDAEIWDISVDLARTVSLVGRLSLLGLMRERGASPGLRHFAQTFGIRLKDKNVSTAKLIRRVSRELDSAVSPIHDAAATALHREGGEPDFESAFARFGLMTTAEMSLAVLAGLSFTVASGESTALLEARRARLEGEFSPGEAAMAVTVLSLVDRYLAESGIVESAVAVERTRNVERERDRLQEEVKRLRRLTQEQKAELTSLRKRKSRPAASPPAAPAGADRDEVRTLRRENHELRKQVEALERGLHPEPASREEQEPPLAATPPAAEEAAAASTPDLSVVRGKNILVVGGDSKQDVYRDLIAELGGRCTCWPGFNARPIGKDDVAGYDAVTL